MQGVKLDSFGGNRYLRVIWFKPHFSVHGCRVLSFFHIEDPNPNEGERGMD